MKPPPFVYRHFLALQGENNKVKVGRKEKGKEKVDKKTFFSVRKRKKKMTKSGKRAKISSPTKVMTPCDKTICT